MRFLKEFGYPDVFQRRIMFYNSFTTFLILSFIFCSASFVLRFHSLYDPVFRTIAIPGLIGILIGNVAGKLLFTRFSSFRAIYLTIDSLFALTSACYILRSLVPVYDNDPLVFLYFNSRPFFHIFCVVLTFFAGIKINYFLKISCGEFIDEKKAMLTYIALIISGLFSGIIVAGIVYIFPSLYYTAALFLIIIIATAFLIKLPYSPSPIYAQDTKEQRSEDPSADLNSKRDDLMFTYLNFGYLVIYIYLGYETIVKFFGSFVHIKISFILLGLGIFFTGFFLARKARTAFWHIYSEMLYPVFFTVFLVLINTYGDHIPFYLGICLFIPPLLIFGFSFHHTLWNVFMHYTHARRFTIIDLSLFILPVPLLVALLYLDFTYFWYFILLYALAAVNIIFPGIHLLQRKIQGYKKLLYFFFSLIFIPLIIIIHLYFDIPLNRELYVSHTRGYTKLQDVNQSADFISQETNVYLNNNLVFNSSDSTLKNLQRSLLPALLYNRDAQGTPGKNLIIYGSQKFFNNPVIGYYENARCLDYIPDRITDLKKLPFTGRSFYFTERSDILTHLYQTRKTYRSIVDAPNLYDQRFNLYRYGSSYYSVVKKSLSPEGFFVQVHNLAHCRPDFLRYSCSNFKSSFKKSIGYIFSDHLVLLGSDNVQAFTLFPGSLEHYRELFMEKSLLPLLFYDDVQILTNLTVTEPGEIMTGLKDSGISPFYFLQNQPSCSLDENLRNSYLTNNLKILDFADPSPGAFYLKNNLMIELLSGSAVFTLIKRAGFHEVNHQYEDETEILFQLRRHAEYNSDLRSYITRLLSFKEEYYLTTAVNLEKNKQWEEAGRLYRAILKINNNNFEANYRLGILSITLQNLDDAFLFLQHAMQLRREDAKVLYQMGVLLFSTGRTPEAMTYLERALTLNENTASVNHYIGLCYEKLGRINEAKSFYEKAALLDPNDREIQSSLQKINQTVEDEKSRWKTPDLKNQSDVEQGESIPLPINKSARDIRLKDSEE